VRSVQFTPLANTSLTYCLFSLLTQIPVLETGTLIGFSTLCWANAVGPSGHVTILEYSPEYASLAKKEFEKNVVKNVRVIVGDAKDSYV
jgi:predicted O-methyltransferase YrrM